MKTQLISISVILLFSATPALAGTCNDAGSDLHRTKNEMNSRQARIAVLNAQVNQEREYRPKIDAQKKELETDIGILSTGADYIKSLEEFIDSVAKRLESEQIRSGQLQILHQKFVENLSAQPTDHAPAKVLNETVESLKDQMDPVTFESLREVTEALSSIEAASLEWKQAFQAELSQMEEGDSNLIPRLLRRALELKDTGAIYLSTVQSRVQVKTQQVAQSVLDIANSEQRERDAAAEIAEHQRIIPLLQVAIGHLNAELDSCSQSFDDAVK